jgi:hypothetical protein
MFASEGVYCGGFGGGALVPDVRRDRRGHLRHDRIVIGRALTHDLGMKARWKQAAQSGVTMRRSADITTVVNVAQGC